LFLTLAAAEIWLVVESLRAGRGQAPWLLRPALLAAVTAAGMTLLAALCLLPGRGAAHRGVAVPDGPPLAEERHRSPRRAAFNAPFLLLLPLAWWLAPGPGWRGVVAGLALALVPVAAWLVAGFRYRLHAAGLEVCAPGLRLAWVPAREITGVEVVAIRPLRDWGGWGVRGSGAHRAFIWDGRQAVRVRTLQGEIVLGHDDPERLARMLAWTYTQEGTS
jgi:hypothetical protein